MIKILVLCLFALVHLVSAQGDVEISLSSRGLNVAAGVAVDILSRDLTSKTIQNIDGQVSLSNIRVTQFDKPAAQVSLSGTGISLSLSGASIRAEANWSYLKKLWFIKIRDSGTVTASSKASISVSVSVRSDGNGKPIINAYACSASLTDLSLKIGGSWASFLYNFLISLFKGTIRSKLESIICQAAKDAINVNGARQLATLNLQAKVNNYLTVDYSLARDPLFTPTFFKSYHKGKFLNDAVVDQVPYMATPTDKMVAFSISENVLNSALRVLYSAGVAKYNYTFNTWDEIAGNIPGNANHGSGPFEVKVEATRVPFALITTNTIKVNLSGVVEITSKPPGQAPNTVLSIQFVLAAEATATIASEVLRGSVNKITPVLVKVTPPIPNTPDSVITGSIVELINLILPSINGELQKGLPLPNVQGVSFIDSSLSLNNKYLSASANVRYTP